MYTNEGPMKQALWSQLAVITMLALGALCPLQSLAQLNNQLTLVAASALARRLPQGSPQQAMATAFRLALQRDPTPEELADLTAYAERHGLPNACRAILNLNEFCFVD